MGELNYAGLVRGVVAQLNAAGTLRALDAVATDELDPPTEFPAVQVRIARATRRPFQMTAGNLAAGPDDVTATLTATCWALSVQGAADAAQQRDQLVAAVVDVIRTDPTIGGRVDWCQPTDIVFSEYKNDEGGGIYSSAALTLEAVALT